MILLDTNIFIDFLRNFKPALIFFDSVQPNEIIFSAITETELIAGNENNDLSKRETLLYFIQIWNKIPVTNSIALLAGDLSRKYGLLVPDAIIAATAILNDAELLTRNIKDFKNVTGLKVKEPY